MRQQSAKRRKGPWPGTVAAVAIAVLVVGTLLSWLVLNAAQPAGMLLAASPRVDAGKVSMRDGLVHVSFPLTVQGEVAIAQLESS